MQAIILTQNSGKILGPIVSLLGWVMNGIYTFMNNVFGIENIGLSIIILTIFIYLCMFPLTLKQQKFSKLSQKMQPEIQAVQKKYKDKKDQTSMQAMQQETQQIYEKYGVSPMGSCLQMLIQMPILLSLYRVFLNVPAYVTSVKAAFDPIANGITSIDGYQDKMTKLVNTYKLASTRADFTVKDPTRLHNYVVDVLDKLPTTGWDTLKTTFPSLTDVINTGYHSIHQMNYFLGISISDTPLNLLRTGWASHQYIILITALLIPILSYLTQLLNIKLMPQAVNQDDKMAMQMKTMNLMMPLFSLVIAFTVPTGLGIYWIAGALIRSIQQFAINKHMEKIDLEDIIRKNQEKAKKKREKMGIAENQIKNNARMSTKSTNTISNVSGEEKESKIKDADTVKKNAVKGSLAEKANLVRDFNEKNNK